MYFLEYTWLINRMQYYRVFTGILVIKSFEKIFILNERVCAI